MNYLIFRHQAWQAISLLSNKQLRESGLISKDDIEKRIKKEYKQHYSK